MKAKAERATFEVSRFDSIFTDNEQFGFMEYYNKEINNLEGRLAMMREICGMDQRQA